MYKSSGVVGSGAGPEGPLAPLGPEGPLDPDGPLGPDGPAPLGFKGDGGVGGLGGPSGVGVGRQPPVIGSHMVPLGHSTRWHLSIGCTGVEGITHIPVLGSHVKPLASSHTTLSHRDGDC